MAAGRGLECEIYGEDTESFQVEVFRGEVESVDRASEIGLGMRAVSGGRAGFSWTCDTSDEGLSTLIREAQSNAASGDETDADVLAGVYGRKGSEGEEREYPPDTPAEMKIEGALAMEEAALAADGRIKESEGASYSEVTGTVCVAGTRGFLMTRREGYCACSTGAAAASQGEVRSGWSYTQALTPGMLDFRGTGIEAGERAAGLLGGRPMPTGRYAVLFDAMAFTDIISMLCEVLSAEMVVRGSSVFSGRLGDKVAASGFTLVDDPFVAGGCFNVPFDDEGVPAIRRELISGGVLEGFLHNSYSARKMGLGQAGNAFRGSFKGIPLPGPTNFFAGPGTAEADGLVSSLGNGIYIQDVMGMHTADPISGDFSAGITGYEVRGGKKERAVCEMTISGNVVSLLDRIAAMGKEIRFTGQFGSPPVLVDGLSVSGR